jgi:hypothetical protein
MWFPAHGRVFRPGQRVRVGGLTRYPKLNDRVFVVVGPRKHPHKFHVRRKQQDFAVHERHVCFVEVIVETATLWMLLRKIEAYEPGIFAFIAALCEFESRSEASARFATAGNLTCYSLDCRNYVPVKRIDYRWRRQELCGGCTVKCPKCRAPITPEHLDMLKRNFECEPYLCYDCTCSCRIEGHENPPTAYCEGRLEWYCTACVGDSDDDE